MEFCTWECEIFSLKAQTSSKLQQFMFWGHSKATKTHLKSGCSFQVFPHRSAPAEGEQLQSPVQAGIKSPAQGVGIPGSVNCSGMPTCEAPQHIRTGKLTPHGSSPSGKHLPPAFQPQTLQKASQGIPSCRFPAILCSPVWYSTFCSFCLAGSWGSHISKHPIAFSFFAFFFLKHEEYESTHWSRSLLADPFSSL